MRSYRLLYVLLALILSGCSIPYQTPEARQQIEHDLQIPPGSVRAARDEAASLDDVAAKWGAGKGWRLYCVGDLVRACEQSAVEQQPVYIAFS